jgi:small GTP-binding protein
VIVDGERIDIALWDTSGQEDYGRLRPLSYAQCDVVVIAFSLVNKQSFLDVSQKWHPEVEHFLPSIPVLLCGTHLEQRRGVSEHISTEQGLILSRRIRSAGYVECSARTGENLRLLFETAVRAYRASTHPGTRRSGCIIA